MRKLILKALRFIYRCDNMQYEVKEVSENNGLQTRARVLETPRGRFVVLQTYTMADEGLRPLLVFDGKKSRESRVVTGRYNGVSADGGFSVTPVERRASATKTYVEKTIHESGFGGGVSFW